MQRNLQKQKYSPIKNKFVGVPDLSSIYKLKLPEDADIEKIVREYKSDPNVEYAHPNYIPVIHIIPDDSKFNEQWGLHNTGQTGGTANSDIDAPESWEIYTGNSNIVVAVVDTGVDWNHPDLTNNIWTNSDEIAGNGIDDDGNGFIDDTRGWDFSDNDNNTMDYHGHGTHCSGIITAVTNNGIGVAGVCWNCKIMPIKMFPNATTDVAANSIIYAANNGAHVLSNSWGYTMSGVFPDTLKNAIDYAISMGSLVVFAAGNSNSSQLYYPGAYEGVIGVAATDHNDTKAYFSNYGNWVDVSAPGVSIYSTILDDTYDYMSGTSMACPFVSGLSALVFSKNPIFTSEQVRAAIENSADNIDSINPDYMGLLGTGRINAYNALNYTPDFTPPIGSPSTPTDDGNYSTSPTINFYWTQGTSSDPESGIKGYYLQVGTTPGGSDKFNSYVGNIFSKSISNCEDGQTYYARVKAKNGSGLYSDWSGNSDGITIQLPPLGEVLDNTDLTWTTGGNANWFGQTSIYYYDNDSAQSGYVLDNQSSYVQTTITGPADLKFYWKVSSEVGYDYLKFYIDGIEQSGKISGEVDWQQKNYEIPSGEHIIKWAYTKDYSVSSGSDAGWLDKVEIGPPDIIPPSAITDLTVVNITQVSMSLTWIAVGDDGSTGTATTYDIRYLTSPIDDTNWGSATQVSNEPSPKSAGSNESFTVIGLSPGTLYYLAIKVGDEVPNWSGLSNVANGTTLAGVGLGESVDNPARQSLNQSHRLHGLTNLSTK